MAISPEAGFEMDVICHARFDAKQRGATRIMLPGTVRYNDPPGIFRRGDARRLAAISPPTRDRRPNQGSLHAGRAHWCGFSTTPMRNCGGTRADLRGTRVDL